MREYETMDRNTNNEQAYRPLGDPPIAHIRSRDPDSCYEGSRQVLARMPNLAAVDPQMEAMARYGQGENRAISSGLSAKVLAGVGIGLFVVAVLSFVLIGDKTPAENQDSAAWQPEVPAPDAATAPPWASSDSLAPSQQASTEVAASPWNGPSPAPAWNIPSNAAPAAGPASTASSQSQPTADQHQQSVTGGSPTELTATGTAPAEPVWGQIHEPVPAAAPAASNPPAATAWNGSPQPASWDTQAAASNPANATPSALGWPSAAQAPSAASPQTAATSPQTAYSAAAADPNAWPAPASGYEVAHPAPAYAGAYQQPQAGVNRSMGLNSSNVQASGAPVSGSQPAAGYPDNSQPYTVGSEPRFDPRAGYGNDTRTANPPAFSQPAPSGSAADYRTADQRQHYNWNSQGTAASASSFGSAPTSYPPASGQSSYPAGGQSGPSSTNPSMPGSSSPSLATDPASSFPAGSYPSNIPPASSYPANNYPLNSNSSGNIPTSNFPTNNIPTNNIPTSTFPTSNIPTSNIPTSSFPASSNYASSSYSPNNLPSSSYGPTGASADSYPAGGYPGSYPAAGYPSNSYPSVGSVTPAAGLNGSTSMPQYNAGANATTPPMGAAQFEGVIEKPTTARASYDSTRPGLY